MQTPLNDHENLNIRYNRIDVLLEKEKVKIYRVMDTVTKDFCVMKIREGKDLSGIYRQLEELHHPNLPEIYEVIYDGSDTVIIEEYIAGEGVDRHIRRETFSEAETVPIMLQMCSAMALFHTLDPVLIHGNIKASNVIVKADGTVKLIDFDVTENDDEEERSDIYSAGALMYEMLTGETFCHGKMCYRGKLKKIIRKCTRVQANRRYRTALQLKKKLEGFLYRRKRNLTVALTAIALAAVAGGVTFVYQHRVSQPVLKSSPKKTKQQLEKEEFEKLFDTFDREKGNMANFLKLGYIDRELVQLLGDDYSRFLEIFDLVEGVYDETEDVYFIGGYRKTFSLFHEKSYAAITIRRNGNIQCAYTYYDSLTDIRIKFATNAEEEYYNIPVDMMSWFMARYSRFISDLGSGKLFLQESDFQKFPRMKVNDEEDTIDPVGEYVLQSHIEGVSGRIHISRQSKAGVLSRYKMKGSIQCEGSERKIDLSFIEDGGRFLADTEYGTYIEMGLFYDSIFLCEKSFFDDEESWEKTEEKLDIFFTGQFVKEDSHE